MRNKILLSIVLACLLSAQISAQAGNTRRSVRTNSKKAVVQTINNAQILPIRRVVLYSNGVAYIERRGTISNNAEIFNRAFDKIIEQALNTAEKERAKILYAEAQKILSIDLPLLPLWYPANIVISNKRVGNVKINQSGDWSFVKDLRIMNE
jgi:ABC-type transport system substrate-binding protein